MLRIQPAKSVSTMVQALWLTLNKARRINYNPNFLSQLCQSCMSLTSAWCQFYWQQSVSPAQICHLSFLYLALIRTPVFSYSRNKHFIIWQMRKVPEVQCESSHLIEKKWISVLILILFDLIKRLRNVWIYILTWLILSIYNLAKTVEIYRDIYWFDYIYVLRCPRELEYILICILTWPNIYFDLSKGVEIYLDLYLDLLSICLDLSLSLRVEIYFDHTWYLSFFLHEQNFWRIKFTPKNANFSR